jgi:hypothetical protein
LTSGDIYIGIVLDPDPNRFSGYGYWVCNCNSKLRLSTKLDLCRSSTFTLWLGVAVHRRRPNARHQQKHKSKRPPSRVFCWEFRPVFGSRADSPRQGLVRDAARGRASGSLAEAWASRFRCGGRRRTGGGGAGHGQGSIYK